MKHLFAVLCVLATLANAQVNGTATAESTTSVVASATDSAAASVLETTSGTESAVSATSAAESATADSTPPAPTDGAAGQAPLFPIPPEVDIDPMPPYGPDPHYIHPNISAPLGVTQFFTPRWQAAHAKAAAFLQGWSNEDKTKIVTGVGWMQDRCVGNIRAQPDKGWPGLCLQDGPAGVRFADQVSLFTPAINAAATFDKGLIYERAKAMGEEFKGKGVNIALAPMTNMGRVAAGGRNWEGFGGDPYLSGWATYQTVRGLQDAGVQACAKHFIGNEEERIRHQSSSNIDDRPLHEVYLHPFLRAVQAEAATFMSSYNRVNGTHADQNSKTLNGILKTELGFAGPVISDWDSQGPSNGGIISAVNGLDMSMPGDIGFDPTKTWWGPHLLDGIRNGSLSEARLNDMAQRIVASWYLIGQDKDYPPVNFDSWTRVGPNNSHVDVRQDHDVLIRKLGAASTVLLKNIDHALPLRAPKSIAVIGSDMFPSPKGPNGWPDHGGDDGTLAIGWGSGTAMFPWLSTPLAALAERAHQDRSLVDWWALNWDTDPAAQMASLAEVAIVGVNSDSGEEYITVDQNIGDRNNLSAWNNGDALIQAVAGQCNNTVVVVHSVGPMQLENWIDHPNVTAVLWAGLPGEESGRSLVDVLYGDYNPSGRLPYTIAHNRSQYPADITYVPADYPYANVNYDEGLDIDYRHFLRRGIAPRFPFGYGGSYTEFSYANIQVSPVAGDAAEAATKRTPVVEKRHAHRGHGDGNATAEDPEFGRSVRPELHAPKWSVSADITNSGEVNGCEVPQLYLSFPEATGEPPRVLRDFDRINLDPGASQTVSFNLSSYDVSIWDVVSQRWVIPDGKFTAIVARHSFDTDGVSTTFCPGKC